MIIVQQSRKILATFVLIVVLMITTACSGSTVSQVDRTTTSPAIGQDVTYAELERGNSPGGQTFGNWVV